MLVPPGAAGVVQRAETKLLVWLPLPWLQRVRPGVRVMLAGVAAMQMRSLTRKNPLAFAGVYVVIIFQSIPLACQVGLLACAQLFQYCRAEISAWLATWDLWIAC